MKTVERTVFVTDDGLEFLTQEQARMHETNLRNIKHFLIRHAPDKTQTGNFTGSFPVAVHSSPGCHEYIIYQYLMKCLGWNAITEGVMGHGYLRGFALEPMNPTDYKSSASKGKLFLSQIPVSGYPKHTDFVEEFDRIVKTKER